MKRALFFVLAATLAFVFACHPTQDGNRNSNDQNLGPAMAASNKIVQIFVHDDPARPGFYEIEDPGAVTLHKRKNQKIAWCVNYDGSTPPTDVLIDNFRSPPPPAPTTATNPFGDGSPGDNTFTILAADFNFCRHLTKTPKANANLGDYKYDITVRVSGAARAHLDPVVIIED